jgi:hypothetical protein
MRKELLKTALIVTYAIGVVISYLVFLSWPRFLPGMILIMLTLPFSLVTGAISAGFSHSGYDFSLDKGCLVAGLANCICLYFLSKRYLSRK